jgi:hypothetical protein
MILQKPLAVRHFFLFFGRDLFQVTKSILCKIFCQTGVQRDGIEYNIKYFM